MDIKQVSKSGRVGCAALMDKKLMFTNIDKNMFYVLEFVNPEEMSFKLLNFFDILPKGKKFEGDHKQRVAVNGKYVYVTHSGLHELITVDFKNGKTKSQSIDSRVKDVAYNHRTSEVYILDGRNLTSYHRELQNGDLASLRLTSPRNVEMVVYDEVNGKKIFKSGSVYVKAIDVIGGTPICLVGKYEPLSLGQKRSEMSYHLVLPVNLMEKGKEETVWRSFFSSKEPVYDISVSENSNYVLNLLRADRIDHVHQSNLSRDPSFRTAKKTILPAKANEDSTLFVDNNFFTLVSDYNLYYGDIPEPPEKVSIKDAARLSDLKVDVIYR